jgi:integrase
MTTATSRTSATGPIHEPSRDGKKVMQFTDLGLRRLNAKKLIEQANRDRIARGQRPLAQVLIWDTAQKGLAILVGTRTKAFRVQFKLHNEWCTASIGRFGEIVPQAESRRQNVEVGKAREIADTWRALARQGIDPRKKDAQRAEKLAFEALVDLFIEHYAKPRQRTWDQTERVLKSNCRPFLKRPVEAITKVAVRELLRSFVANGQPYKAAITRAWLKKLWRWAYEEDYVSAPIMEAVRLDYEKRERVRVFSDDEIKATWAAATKLPTAEGAFVKLLILLAPRKTALAAMRRSHLDDTSRPSLWTTPFELTKSRKTSSKKREYLTPLPPLAQRVFKGALVRDGNEADRLFPTLPVHETRAGRPTFYGVDLKSRLVELGAPSDFTFHGWRHTIATYLENEGHSEWERGLALNHSGSASVTAGYSHGYPLELKRSLLCKWADHVRLLVEPEGVALLR